MDENCCRFCLTSDIDHIFKSVQPKDAIANQVNLVFGIKITGHFLICQRCDSEIVSSFVTYNRIKDADEYIRLNQLESKQNDEIGKRVAVIYECDVCEKSFSDKKSLELHIPHHNGKSCNVNCFYDKTAISSFFLGFACFFCKSTFQTAKLRCDHHLTQHTIEWKFLTQIQKNILASKAGEPNETIEIEEED